VLGSLALRIFGFEPSLSLQQITQQSGCIAHKKRVISGDPEEVYGHLHNVTPTVKFAQKGFALNLHFL
jgi:hypothetical protein